MNTLYDQINAFDGRKAKSEKELQAMFHDIAEVALYGGYFLVNQAVKIYPVDIEFYFYGERPEDLINTPWMCDYYMYHRGNKEEVPYFPLMSFNPHSSGVDFTFENEQEEYRASFLIRAHRYVDDDTDEVFDQPTVLRENLFGYTTCLGKNLLIEWKKEPECGPHPIKKDVRWNFHDKSGAQDLKLWRFIKDK